LEEKKILEELKPRKSVSVAFSDQESFKKSGLANSKISGERSGIVH